MQKQSSAEKTYDGNFQDSTSPGVILRRERKKKGLSVEEISRITCIRPHYINAIESDNWDALPPVVFVKGFIKAYAKALDLDEKMLLDLLGDVSPVRLKLPKSLKREDDSKTRIILGVFIIISVMVGVFVIHGYVTKEDQKEQKIGAPAVKEGKSITSKVQSQSLENEEENISLEIESEEPSEPQTVTPEMDNQIIAPEIHTLQCSVKARTWMRVKIDDKEPREFIFEPGARLKWEAKEGFDIVIGNAGGVELIFNGREVGTLGKIGQVVRLRLPENYNPSEE
jgi:cytoskeletal protein RodZ